jgi:hypothetical protein
MHTLRNSLQFAGRALLIAGGFGLALAADLGNQAAAGLTAVDGNKGANRTRPLCEYPKFTGAPGTENSAASFTCVAE